MTKKDKKDKKILKMWTDFKAFINRGNAFMLAVGVVIGGAFNSIETSFVNMLLSIATWPVPGGLKGFITVLPALTPAQRGASFNIDGQTVNLQAFSMAEVNERVIQFAKQQGVTLTVTDTEFIGWKESLLKLYDQHGTTYTSKGSAIIDWGGLLTAIISFIIVAFVLFMIVKVISAAAEKKAALESKALV
ncbi:MAG: MscL family protein, partial [Erysipelotrichia bacterium]|nr:MscL family protein [Erysipelotrichia bacterium]